MTREETEQSLLELLVDLGDDEVRSLHWLATRLFEGQRLYGRVDIVGDPRDWRKERAEELADSLIYAAFEAIRQRDVMPPTPHCIADHAGSQCDVARVAPKKPRPLRPRFSGTRPTKSQHSQSEGGLRHE